MAVICILIEVLNFSATLIRYQNEIEPIFSLTKAPSAGNSVKVAFNFGT